MILTLHGEVFKLYNDIKRYLFNYAVSLVAQAIFIAGLYLGLSGKNPSPVLLGGLIMWLFAGGALSDMSNIITEERHLGTFERLHMVKASFISILVARSVVHFVFYALRTAIIVAILILLMRDIATGISALFSVRALAAAMLVITALYGWGFALAAVELIWKRTGAVLPIIEYVFLVFSGIIFPLSQMPAVVRPLSGLIPLTWAIRTFEGIPGGAPVYSAYAMLAAHCAGIWVIGYFIFRLATVKVRKTGEIGFY